ncbi:hypothetical protein ACE6ED_09285 [Paenibacillus sp. CN-4]|uniref:hypothetical protein n=1 Tax=Paenibacillus nanchangensis TaxID=3348343 RepID=UPI00397A6CA6
MGQLQIRLGAARDRNRNTFSKAAGWESIFYANEKNLQPQDGGRWGWGMEEKGTIQLPDLQVCMTPSKLHKKSGWIMFIIFWQNIRVKGENSGETIVFNKVLNDLFNSFSADEIYQYHIT